VLLLEIMRRKAGLAGALFVCLSVGVQAVEAQSNGQCTYPVGLAQEVAKDYPDTRPVSLTDLDEYDRRLYTEDHGTGCPGLVKLDFYGDGKPTWALGLTQGTGFNQTVELVVARQLGNQWELHSVEKTTGSAVVWSEGPGTYGGRHGPAIRARNPVILFVGYESWAVAYAWIDGKIVKAQITD
jgi:hypothetical protein